jgi:hypothetical protein
MADNPSLKSTLGESIALAYRRAIVEVERETGLERGDFQRECPWTFEQMTAEDFWPEG